jgi:Acyl-CoA reductase (LuxC)
MQQYNVGNGNIEKVVGLIFAGNIPLVGFHDMLCALVCGFQVRIKLSSKDRVLMTYVLDVLKKINKSIADRVECVEKLKGCDAVIATGSNLSANYFQKYFYNIPHIIRKHRNSVAIINGKEVQHQLRALADDVFMYFGLGCRNVSKLYIPKAYNLTELIEIFNEAYPDIIHHTKYRNNFDYQLAILLLNGVKFYQGHNVLILPEHKVSSPLACLYYEEYSDHIQLREMIDENQHHIQAICSAETIEGISTLQMGSLQRPSLFEYADNVDTMQFLINI